MAEGKPIFLQPDLVSSNGTSMIPNGQTSFPLVGTKIITALSNWCVKSTDSDTNPTAPTWTPSTPTLDSINNEVDITLASGDIAIVSGIKQNNPLNQSTPLPVESVVDKVYASNSHSIYKGAIYGNCIGKVQVGNGDNGYESKVIENAFNSDYDNYYDYVAIGGVSTTYTQGKRYLLDYETFKPNILAGRVVERVGATTTTTLNSSTDFVTNTPTYWNYNQATPSHSTLALDNSDSPASKWFTTIATDDDGYLYEQVFMQEMEYNATDADYADDIPEFSNLTNGLTDNLLGSDRVVTKVLSKPLGVRK